MPSTSARHEEQFRVTTTAALVNLVAANGGTVAHHRLGDALHRIQDDRRGLHPDVAAALDDIPLMFTVRDGWTSPELNRHLQDACVLGALDVAVGGIIRLGPKAPEYLSGDHAVTPGRAPLVSVPAAGATSA